MNLRRPNASAATGTFNRSRTVVPMSGICTDCLDGCKGGCEVWLASFRGSRNFRLSLVSRKDLTALTEEAAKVSGIPYVMDAYRQKAEKILAE